MTSSDSVKSQSLFWYQPFRVNTLEAIEGIEPSLMTWEATFLPIEDTAVYTCLGIWHFIIETPKISLFSLLTVRLDSSIAVPKITVNFWHVIFTRERTNHCSKQSLWTAAGVEPTSPSWSCENPIFYPANWSWNRTNFSAHEPQPRIELRSHPYQGRVLPLYYWGLPYLK